MFKEALTLTYLDHTCQVLPTCRARDLANALVLELFTRVQGPATFTTVSGRVNNHTKPERIYRRLGFAG